MLPTPASATEVIPGYTITQRIGTGGYGEVWKADAPGGLTKAVKFIYGCLDDQRAQNELRALERVKQVRHPFLLSLERIEVIDGQLVIVTELAEESLKDRFDACRAASRPGIPRDELLGYLSDAADALDYMSQKYGLQHLDVKPENLLIVGGRVKVADFGLVKDLHGRSISLLGGMTPVYAAPEVFDSRPSAHSDQYSLAIVYQELLTGVLPFPGRTPAQLAAQHMGAKPQLTVLPPAERRVLARALAKNPDDRFPTCKALIESLLHPPTSGEATDADDASPRRTPGDTTSLAGQKVDTRTLAIEACVGEAADADEAHELVDLHGSRDSCDSCGSTGGDPWLAGLVGLAGQPIPEAIDGGPVPLAPGSARLRPTLLLGLGGTGLRTLRRLKRRLADRFGDAADVRSVRLLAVDTDVKAISASTQPDGAGALNVEETMAVPLRRAIDYREQSRELLHWLSRRWLFNLPRSQQPEGIRPLGRLALVDHRAKLVERASKILASLREPETLTPVAQATGMTAEPEAIRIVVVGSISGGTSGGMLADVADVLREAMDRAGARGEVVGLLAHATPRIPSAKSLAVANACVCLSELDRHALAHSHDGAPGPAPFDRMYLVHLGDDLDEEGYDAATADLAEFLSLWTVTPAGAFFDGAAALDEKDAASEGGVFLRTFGLCQIGCSRGDLPRLAAEALCGRLIERWRGVTSSAASHGAGSTAEAAGVPELDPELEFELDEGRLAQQVDDILQESLGGDPATRLAEMLAQQRAAAAGHGATERARIDPMAAIEAILGACDVAADPEEAPPDSFQRAVTLRLRQLAARQADVVSDWLVGLVQSSNTRLQGAMHAAGWVAERIRQLEGKLGLLQQHLQTALDQSRRCLAGDASVVAAHGKGWLHLGRAGRASDGPAVHGEDYFHLRLDELALAGTRVLLRSLRSRVAGLTDRLRDFDGQLNRIAGQFHGAASWSEAIATAAGPSSPAWHDLQLAMADALRTRLPELAETLDHEFLAASIEAHGGLARLIDESVGLDRAFLESLRAAARKSIARALTQLDPAHWLLEENGQTEGASDLLRTGLTLTKPRLSPGGGTRRFLLACPNQAGPALAEAIGLCGGPRPTVLSDGGGEVIFCEEVGRLSAVCVAAALVAGRPDHADLAARLHTRRDIPWSQFAPPSRPDQDPIL